ncbi:hypothetical protein H4R34_001711 [Dimargaris verticillata]|uniref:SNF2 family N-terminal domain-containing protein n=1 Tax=Dimargaris verticillata TaxID=2761393 RepID=A0A9W8B510_9FUNG|nr:hypothetical protein H4R34_001711 [Dimargaris verticillata]
MVGIHVPVRRRSPMALLDSDDESSSASQPSPTALEPIVISSREPSPVAPRVQVTNPNQQKSGHAAPPVTTSITQLTSSFQKAMIAPPRVSRSTKPSAAITGSTSSLATANRLAHDYAHGGLIAPSKMSTKKWDKARYLSRDKPTIDLSSLRDALPSLPPEPMPKRPTETRKTTQRAKPPPGVPDVEQADETEDQLEIHSTLNDSTIDHLRDGARASTPPRMTVELMDYQQQGLYWLLEQERSSIRGGILSDEMGLGKTVQIISLLVASKYPQASGGEKQPHTAAPTSTGPTLIVGPVAVVDQWVAEVKAKTHPGTLTVYKYHGATKITAAELQRYDVVVTTYPTVMSRWSAAGEDAENIPINRQGSDSLGLPYVADPRASFMRVRWERIVLDESHIIKNYKSKTARACMSLTAKYRWCLSGTPIQNNFTELYSYTQFLQFTEYNLWPLPNEQTTYSTDRFAPKPKAKSKADQVLPHVHSILKKLMLRRTKALVFGKGKERSLPPKTTKLVRLHLSLPERSFYETMRGLALADVSSYMTTSNQGYIHILALLTRLRQTCGHPSLAVDFVVQHGVLDDCLYQSNAVAQWAPYIMGLPLSLRKSLILQASSTIVCAFCHIPSAQACLMGPCGHFHCSECPKDQSIIFSSDDESSDSSSEPRPVQCSTCDKAAKEQWTGPSWQTLQFVLKYDPSLLSRHVSTDGNDLADTTASEASESESDLDDDDDTPHAFLRPTTSITCPPKPSTAATSDDTLDTDTIPPDFATAPGPLDVPCSVVHQSFVSTKISKLMDIIQTIRHDHPRDKIIVFSYFVELLVRIGTQLRARGIQSLSYNGSMSTRERQSTLSDFESACPGPISSSQPDAGLSCGAPVVLLMSTKAGNAGINLTTANHVILMDMWWNPASDMQAIDRVHRVGQQKPVFVYRMLVNNTVEEQLYTLQTAKLNNIQGTFEQNTLSTTKLTQGDLRFIFDITND